MPAVDALAGHPKPSGDLSLADASGQQLSSAKPADFQLLMVNAVGRCHGVEPATHAQPIPSIPQIPSAQDPKPF
jgi:hypothetical protein